MALKYGCSCLLITLLLSFASYAGTNLVENPGFEDGTTGWAGRSCTIETVTSPVHNGAFCAKASGRTETWQGIKQSMLGKMQSGKTYQISGWVRIENADSETVTVSVEQTDDAGTQYINVASDVGSNIEWIELKGDFTLNSTGELTVLDIYFEGPAADISFFIDDVSVSDIAAEKTPDPNAME